MRKLFGICIAAVLAIGFSCSESGQQKTEAAPPQIKGVSKSIKTPTVEDEAPQALVPQQKDYEYSLPEELNFYGKAQSEDYYGRNFNLVSHFRPIGWSEDGKFAYVEEPADQACGCYFFEIKIQDMITDSITWKWEYVGDEENPAYEDMDGLWAGEYQRIKKALNKHKIVPEEKTTFTKGAEFSVGDTDYKIYLDLSQRKTEWNYFEAITDEKIRVEQKGAGSKTVYAYKEKEFSLLLDANIVGVLKSPFQDRIAVLYRKEIRGYEGPPNVLECALFGCGLSKGFK